MLQVAPPLKLTPATLPREPPLDQRSCCQKATMLSGSLGFTSSQGSISLSGKLVPLPATIPGKFPHALNGGNGLRPETWTCGPMTSPRRSPPSSSSSAQAGAAAMGAKAISPMAICWKIVRLAMKWPPLSRGERSTEGRSIVILLKRSNRAEYASKNLNYLWFVSALRPSPLRRLGVRPCPRSQSRLFSEVREAKSTLSALF